MFGDTTLLMGELRDACDENARKVWGKNARCTNRIIIDDRVTSIFITLLLPLNLTVAGNLQLIDDRNESHKRKENRNLQTLLFTCRVQS
jgi:hypothetical protein